MKKSAWSASLRHLPLVLDRIEKVRQYQEEETIHALPPAMLLLLRPFTPRFLTAFGHMFRFYA